MATQTKKLYLLRNTEMDFETIMTDDLSADIAHYIRLGVCEQAEFTMASDSDQVAAAVASLQAMKKKEMADSQARLNSLDERINSLLAITHEA